MTMWTSDVRQRAESVYAASQARAGGLGHQGSGVQGLELWGPVILSPIVIMSFPDQCVTDICIQYI